MRKLKSLLIAIAGLSLSLGAAIGVGLKNTQNPTLKAEAANTNMYLDLSASTSEWESANAVFYVYWWDGAQRFERMQSVSNHAHFYSASCDFSRMNSNSGHGFRFIRVDPNSGNPQPKDVNNWTDGDWYTWHDGTIANCYVLNGWNFSWDNTVSVDLSVGFSKPVDNSLKIYIPGDFNGWSTSALMTNPSGDRKTFIFSAITVAKACDYKICYSTGNFDWGTAVQVDTTNKSTTIIDSDNGNTKIIRTDVTFAGCYLRGDWGDDNYGWSAAGQVEMVEVSEGVVRATNVLLPANGKVKIVSYSNDTIAWGQVSGSVSYNEGYPVRESDGDCVVEKTGTYTITCTFVSDIDENNKFWSYNFVGSPNPNLEAAITFATNFVSAMYSECPYNYSTESINTGKTSETLADAWEDQLEAFASLSSSTPDAVPFLTTSSGDTVSQITTMKSSYDYVYGHYATVRAVNDNNADFLGRNPTIVASLSTIVNIPRERGNSDAALIVVASISSISLVAVGGYFFIRKRKEY